MSAAGSAGFGSPSTTAEQRAHEPSMEEILASIRRIIADDQMLPLTRSLAAPVQGVDAPAAEFPAPPPEWEPAIPAPPAARAPEKPKARFEPAPAVSAFQGGERPAPYVPDFERKPLPYPSAARAAPAQPQAPMEIEPPAKAAPQPPHQAPPGAETLMSPRTGESVSSAFGALATSMFLQNTGMVEEALREMLRPLLKQWLDDNLPVMVERLVRTEIERVARGGRG